MKSETEYVIMWRSDASGVNWRFHNYCRTAKAALRKRDELSNREPHIEFKAQKIVTTDL